MNKLIAVTAALLACGLMSQQVFAEGTTTTTTSTTAASPAGGDSDVKFNAELRARYHLDQNSTGLDKDNGSGNKNYFTNRNLLGVTFRKGEMLTGHVTLLHHATWGADVTKDTAPGHADSSQDFNRDNTLLVQEAWGWWKFAEGWSMKFGRGAMTIGDGRVVDKNDYEEIPNTFEGGAFIWDSDFATVNILGVRGANLTPAYANFSNPQWNFYGLTLDFKNLPDVLNMAHLHVLQENRNGNKGGTTDFPALGTNLGASLNRTRLGLVVAGDVTGLDYRVTYAMYTGKMKDVANSIDNDEEASMLDAELGYKMPEMMNFRVYVGYHMDSGDKDTTDDKNESYQPFFYNRHDNAGLMDILDWGGLTYLHAGVSLSPIENTNVGLRYTMFTRTEKGTNSAAPFSTFDIDSTTGSGPWGSVFQKAAATTADAKTDLGSEISLTADHTYDTNFNIAARVSMFTPGEYYKKVRADEKQKETYTQVWLQGKLLF